MGSPKQLLRVDGRPLLELVVERANASALDEVVVVLGAEADRIATSVEFGRAHVVVNEDHRAGMGTSLRAGLSAISADAALVILADQPGTTTTLIDALLDLHVTSGKPIAAVTVDGRIQPPLLIERGHWPPPERLTGDAGLRELVRAEPELVAVLAVDRLDDVDTPDDYQRLIRG
jgi:CTP:molybdopterin cytidylyltransferase MocA